MPNNNPDHGAWRLTVRSEFSASHSLRNYGGKCEALHGHNFGVELCVEGRTLDPKTEILVDFKVLKTELAQAMAPLDHSFLNEVAPFTELNPSSENIARYLYETIEARLSAYENVGMAYVTVSERAGQSATYFKSTLP